MGYISAHQAAIKWGISKRRVQVLCAENRIKDATRIGNMWVVPEDAEKPADGRLQTRPMNAPTARAVRTALKKLTADAYREINAQLNHPRLSKMVFVSLLATTVFCDVQNAESAEDAMDAYRVISSELMEDVETEKRMSFYRMFSSLILSFEEYICRYSDYMDDILSWAYQYVNKLSSKSGLESTQFFTEQYMIEYLTKDILEATTPNGVYLDPACGGGNFLSHLLGRLYSASIRISDDPVTCMQDVFSVLYGYELDPDLAAVASVNLKLKALTILDGVQQVSKDQWRRFCPNIFTSVEAKGFGFLEADFSLHRIKRISDGKQDTLSGLVVNAKGIYTNPPFQTVKGMDDALKRHLKTYFPDSKCDLCNAFLLQCIDKIPAGGRIGLVTQSSWLYLDSFENLRRRVIVNTTIASLADLGSGAFYDLSGEKANVALVRLKKTHRVNAQVKVLTLRDVPLKEKAAVLAEASGSELLMEQELLFSGEYAALSLNRRNRKGIEPAAGKYGDYGVPMQGTSTGNAAELIGYYWEHLNDPEWIPVSKGGGYSRWCGLNSYVLKWGTDGEYIRATKGSALRNVKYFDRTVLVYSDTGTSGFNARLLEKGQVFVASGPGIRDVAGNPYSHLALLNSRVFSYYLKTLSPKLTVAAGYIARVPVPEGLLERPELERLGRACYDRKRERLKARPNNLEWSAPAIDTDSLHACVSQLFIREMQDELAKLICEKALDDFILEAYALQETELKKLDETFGVPAVTHGGTPDVEKLDNSMAQTLDANCELIRTRANKQSLGSDGILEFIAQKEKVSPGAIVDLVSAAPETFVECMTRYRNLVLHSIVLAALGFRLENSEGISVSELRRRFFAMYPGLKKEWNEVEDWIASQFNSIHMQAFCSRPYYQYEAGKFTIEI